MSEQSDRLSVTDLDPFDDAEFDEFHAVFEAAQTFGREATATPWELDELRATMQEDTQRKFRHGIVGRADGRIVAAAFVEGSLLDNLEIGSLQVNVHPDHRRRGYGTEMLARCEEVARERGRSTVLAMCDWPYDGHPDGDGDPGVEFGRRHGYAMALVEIQRRLDLPVAEETLDRLAASAAEKHAGYTLRSWSGPVPEELLQGWAEVTSALMTEAPMGEIDREPEVPDPAVVREAEALAVKQGRELYATAALDADGHRRRVHELRRQHRGLTARLPVGDPGPRRAPRPPARHGGQGRQPPAAPGGPARPRPGRHLERRGQRAT